MSHHNNQKNVMEAIKLLTCIHKTYKNTLKGPQGRSKRLKKKQKNGQTPPGELGFDGVTPFLSKKSVQRVKLASPEDPKIVKNEV